MLRVINRPGFAGGLSTGTEMTKLNLVLIAIATSLVGACGQSNEAMPSYGDGTGEARVELPSAPQPKRYSKDEFTAYVSGKTKEAIRVEFGPPTAVNDEDDSWYYGFLPIYDTYAGTQSSVRIRFMGTDDPTSEVVEVWYP